MGNIIFMFSGLSDIEIAGNQSLKNSLAFLSKFGHTIVLFTFMPTNYYNLQDPEKVFSSRVRVNRLPVFLSGILNLGKKIKDAVGKQQTIASAHIDNSEMSGTYLREYNFVGRFFYLIFLFVLYLPCELLRGIFNSFKNKPDLIYGINCHGAVVASILGRLLKIPVITRFHGVSITRHDLTNWKNRLFVLDEIAGLKVKSNAVIITNDGTQGDEILKLLDVHDRKIYFWMNGLDMNHLALPYNWRADDFKNKLGLAGKKIILMVSRLATWKRVDRGLRCIHSLVTEHDVSDVVLVVAGDGPERNKLEAMAKNLSIREHVLLLGHIPHSEIVKYYSISDIFMSLYDFSNLGNPLLESMYFGTPIVTLDDGSTKHLLRDGYNSLLIRKNALETELPLQIKTLLEDKQLKKQITMNLKDSFKKNVRTWEERMREENIILQHIIQ